jgi:hypothetical protein
VIDPARVSRRINDTVAQFASNFYMQLDFRDEAENLRRFNRNFASAFWRAVLQRPNPTIRNEPLFKRKRAASAGCLRCGKQLLVLRAPQPQLTRRRVRAVRPDRRRAIVSFPTPVDDLVSQHIVVETFEIGESVADYLHKAGDAPKITKWKLVGENTWVPADPSHSLEAHFSGTGGTGGTLQAALSPTGRRRTPPRAVCAC